MVTLRLATLDDAAAIDALMLASIDGIFPSTYDARQTASAVTHIDAVDRTLIEDGTFYVIEDEGEVVACGGWGRRDRYTHRAEGDDGPSPLLDPAVDPAPIRFMFTRPDHTRRGYATRILEACVAAARAEGFRRLLLRASLPGVPVYVRFGFSEVDRFPVTFTDGVSIDAVDMERQI